MDMKRIIMIPIRTWFGFLRIASERDDKFEK